MTTDEGGRNHPLAIGDYRANWSIDAPDPQNVGGAPLTTDNGEGIALGETAAVQLFPVWPDFWKNVKAGTALFAFEGPKLVGTAVATEVVPPSSRPSHGGRDAEGSAVTAESELARLKAEGVGPQDRICVAHYFSHLGATWGERKAFPDALLAGGFGGGR
ncbi:MAG: hypothetical protein QOF45_80 [Gaiellaceae bacterium]|nr:hypothetical protein [Gaiellaceae bacterium]